MNMRKQTMIFFTLLVIILSIYVTRGVLPGSNQQEPQPGAELIHDQASSLAQELYQLRNPFIGDASANSQILNALLPENETGPYHMELETAERPYVLNVILEEMPKDTVKKDEDLYRQGLLILALIDNADAVQLTYPLTFGTEGEDPVVSAVRVSRETLYETLGVNESNFELTPEVLDQLLAME